MFKSRKPCNGPRNYFPEDLYCTTKTGESFQKNLFDLISSKKPRVCDVDLQFQMGIGSWIEVWSVVLSILHS